MSSKVSITGTKKCVDPYYRYDMDALQIRHEGRGNGQKTVLLNLHIISDQLDRPLEILIKYFGIELSAACRQDSTEKTHVIINGSYTAEQLTHTMNTFIDQFVLCPICNLPETALGIKKETVRHKCKSCGAKEVIPDNHKLVKYILKLYIK